MLVQQTQWGVDFTYDCTGNTSVMRAALEAAHRSYVCVCGGWGGGLFCLCVCGPMCDWLLRVVAVLVLPKVVAGEA